MRRREKKDIQTNSFQQRQRLDILQTQFHKGVSCSSYYNVCWGRYARTGNWKIVIDSSSHSSYVIMLTISVLTQPEPHSITTRPTIILIGFNTKYLYFPPKYASVRVRVSIWLSYPFCCGSCLSFLSLESNDSDIFNHRICLLQRIFDMINFFK